MRYKEIDSLGVRVALIAPQPHENLVGVSKTYDAKFDFFTDEGNAAARALGIENINGTPMGMQLFGYDNDTPLPTVIITGKDGKIVWTHETDNYCIRPESAPICKCYACTGWWRPDLHDRKVWPISPANG